ncbi:hypothetical protein TNCV_1800261 [Trichonephila clavipes]|nr:hypothetical protein TNCV_1800261 [Trichonephila clavipes]
MQVTVRFGSVPPQFRGRTPWGWSEASHLSSPSTNLTRGLAARRQFRVPPCLKTGRVGGCFPRDRFAALNPPRVSSVSLGILPIESTRVVS